MLFNDEKTGSIKNVICTIGLTGYCFSEPQNCKKGELTEINNEKVNFPVCD